MSHKAPDSTKQESVSLNLSTSLLRPVYHCSAGLGHVGRVLIRACFTGQTEKCHPSPFPAARQSPFFPHLLEHTSNGPKDQEQGRTEHRTSQMLFTFNKPNMDVFHTGSCYPSGLLPPPVRGYTLDLSHQLKVSFRPKWTVLRFIISIHIVSVFLIS